MTFKNQKQAKAPKAKAKTEVRTSTGKKPPPLKALPPLKGKKADGKKAGDKAPQKPLTGEIAKKRVQEIYRLQKKVEANQETYDNTKSRASKAHAALKASQDELQKEIHDQRVGPGPLFKDV